jgi:hypothetical protein
MRSTYDMKLHGDYDGQEGWLFLPTTNPKGEVKDTDVRMRLQQSFRSW